MNNNTENKEIKRKNGAIIGLSIATGVLALSTLGLGIGLGVVNDQSMSYKTELENVYQRSLYDLVDSVNNTEIKLSKLLASSGNTYQKKMLLEVSKNTNEAQGYIASLPLSQKNIEENIKLINQISGYTSTLAEKLANGGSLTTAEIDTLESIYQNILQLKNQLNKFVSKVEQGYSIVDNSLELDGEQNFFTRDLLPVKDVDIDYPTMIYDGPFSDSVVNSEIKGLTGAKVSREDAAKKINASFKDVVSLSFENEMTGGRFDTYNFSMENADSERLYVQVSQIGGHILTVSGAGHDDKSINIDKEQAKTLALNFVKANGIENPEVVWTDTILDQTYFNIAPIQKGVVLYPDLIKVKVDNSTGTIVGYDATTYFTNHTARTLSTANVSESSTRAKIPNKFEIASSRLVLAPLEYNREVLCYEYECDYQGDTYYFYLNAETGNEENILKVIETNDGSKLL